MMAFSNVVNEIRTLLERERERERERGERQRENQYIFSNSSCFKNNNNSARPGTVLFYLYLCLRLHSVISVPLMND
jgi:hypothetical protein